MAGPRFQLFMHALPSMQRVGGSSIPFKTIRYVETLNRSGTLDLYVPVTDPSIASIEPYATGAFLDEEGSLFGGGIIYVDDLALDSGVARYSGQGFWSYFREGRRKIYSQQGMSHSAGATQSEILFNGPMGGVADQLQIVQDLIAHCATIAAGANIPVTVRINAPGGVSGVFPVKTWHAYEDKDVGSAIEEIANTAAGFDFACSYAWDQTKLPWQPIIYLDLFYPQKGIGQPAVYLEHGKNCTLARRTRGGMMQGAQWTAAMANPLTGKGAGNADAQIRDVEIDGSFLFPSGPYPWYDGVALYPEESDPVALASRTRARLSRTKFPQRVFTVNCYENTGGPGVSQLRLGSFSLGDTVFLRAKPPGTAINIAQSARVTQQTIQIDDAGLKEWQVLLTDDSASLGT